ncbi:MAG: hypothetical protein M2R45_03097 [Verrucomicrobia subdivision 3 bacterium]|nr:hypothetical protein [Limisphaerales bacterium]MCS1413165.1 hypothetical protein [Limisphaerales bacterium]
MASAKLVHILISWHDQRSDKRIRISSIVAPCDSTWNEPKKKWPRLLDKKVGTNSKRFETDESTLWTAMLSSIDQATDWQESAEISAEIFHPDTFNFGHRDLAWRRYAL